MAARRFSDIGNAAKWFTYQNGWLIAWGVTMSSESGEIFLPEAPGPNVNIPSSEKLACALRLAYDVKIGELGCFWSEIKSPIEYSYAKIKLGDLFDFYTTSDGVLKLPEWRCFKYIVDQYAEENPRFKYDPSHAREFVGGNSFDQLEKI